MKPRDQILAVCVMLSQLPMSAAAADREPVAIVSELHGSATVTERGKPRRGLQVYDWLTEGASITVANGSSVVLVLASGARFALKERARVAVRPGLRTSPDVQALSPWPPLPNVAPIASAAGGAQRDPASPTISGAIRIRGPSIRNLYPSGQATIADNTTLRFDGPRGVTAYLVTVEDEKRTPILELQTERGDVRVPASALEPGRRYTWRVSVVGDSGTLPATATFVTLPALTAKSRSALRSSLPADHPGTLILLARIDERLGLLMEARDALAAAVARSPADPRAQEMLAGIEKQLQ